MTRKLNIRWAHDPFDICFDWVRFRVKLILVKNVRNHHFFRSTRSNWSFGCVQFSICMNIFTNPIRSGSICSFRKPPPKLSFRFKLLLFSHFNRLDFFLLIVQRQHPNAVSFHSKFQTTQKWKHNSYFLFFDAFSCWFFQKHRHFNWITMNE